MGTDMDSQCATCANWGKVGGGDWVPYGMGSTRLPFEYGCKEDESGRLEEAAMKFQCSEYKECPRCPKHPNQYITTDGGCNECECETWREMDESVFERR